MEHGRGDDEMDECEQSQPRSVVGVGYGRRCAVGRAGRVIGVAMVVITDRLLGSEAARVLRLHRPIWCTTPAVHLADAITYALDDLMYHRTTPKSRVNTSYNRNRTSLDTSPLSQERAEGYPFRRSQKSLPSY
jgi:hypothetical protein